MGVNKMMDMFNRILAALGAGLATIVFVAGTLADTSRSLHDPIPHGWVVWVLAAWGTEMFFKFFFKIFS